MAHLDDPLGMSLFLWKMLILLLLYWFLTRLRDAWVIRVNNWPFWRGLSRQWWQKVCIADTICGVIFFSKFCIQMMSGWWEQWMQEVYEFLANFDGLSFLASFDGLNVFVVCSYIAQWAAKWQERPYHDDSTASRLLSEVKHRRAWLVLRWGTTLESQVLFFCFSCSFFATFHPTGLRTYSLHLPLSAVHHTKLIPTPFFHETYIFCCICIDL